MIRTSRLVALAAGLLLISAPATATTPVPPGATPVPVTAGQTTSGIDVDLPAAGAISGTVTTTDGTPIKSIRAIAYTSDGQRSSEVRTDADGRYTIRSLPAGSGRYTVCFYSYYLGRNLVSRCAADVAVNDAHVSPSSPQRVSVTLGATTSGVDATLRAGATVSGKVTAAGSTAGLKYVQVYVTNRSTGLVAQTETGKGGTYRLSSLAPSAKGYTVCVEAGRLTGGPSKSGYVPRCYGNSPWRYNTPHPTVLHIAAGRSRTRIDVALPRGGVITGRVTAAGNGTALPMAPVYVFDKRGPLDAGVPFTTYQVTTTAKGGYRLAGLPANVPLTVCAGVPYSTDLDDELAQSQAAHANALARCYRTADWLAQNRGNASRPAAGATTVRVRAGQTHSGVDIRLPRGGSITGRVTDATTGKPIAYANVAVYPADAPVTHTASGPQGYFTVRSLPPSSAGYTVCVRNGYSPGTAPGYAPACYHTASWDGGTVPVDAGRVPLARGQHATGIDIALSPAGAIAGTISHSGTPLERFAVYVLDASGDVVGYTSAYEQPERGAYLVRGLAPSTTGYRVCVVGEIETMPWSGNHKPVTGHANTCYGGAAWSQLGDPSFSW